MLNTCKSNKKHPSDVFSGERMSNMYETLHYMTKGWEVINFKKVYIATLFGNYGAKATTSRANLNEEFVEPKLLSIPVSR